MRRSWRRSLVWLFSTVNSDLVDSQMIEHFLVMCSFEFAVWAIVLIVFQTVSYMTRNVFFKHCRRFRHMTAREERTFARSCINSFWQRNVVTVVFVEINISCFSRRKLTSRLFTANWRVSIIINIILHNKLKYRNNLIKNPSNIKLIIIIFLLNWQKLIYLWYMVT